MAHDTPLRAAGIDLGRVRVGLAVSDELGLYAHPRPHLNGRDLGRLLGTLAAFAEREDIGVFVVGLPRSLDGTEGAAAKRARDFARRLKQRTSRRVELCDEWLTTREAMGRLRDQGLDARQARDRVDSAAAAIVLQSWLDGQRTAHGDQRGE
jgi:putative Holliday junction resolvase